MIENEAGFVVLAGSTSRRSSSGTFPEGYRAMREELLRSGRLTDDRAADIFRFDVDVVFSSPSAAAAIVAGRSASGLREWKLETAGVTYRYWKLSHVS